jgi:prepilin peptidase CpaA
VSYSVFQAALWGASLAALLFCARTDVKDRIIRNECVAVIAACGLALAATAWPRQIWSGAAVAFAALVCLGFLHRLGLLGGGDAKLISAVTLLTPPAAAGQLLVAIACAGGALSCVYLAARRALRRTAAARNAPPSSGQSLFARERARIIAGQPMPYAVAVAGGVIFHLAARFS